MLIENQIELQHTCIYHWFKTGSSENQRIFNGENFVSCYGYRCCHVRRVLYKRSAKVKSFSDFNQSQLWNFHQYYSLQGNNIFHKIYLIWQRLRTSFYNPGLKFFKRECINIILSNLWICCSKFGESSIWNVNWFDSAWYSHWYCWKCCSCWCNQWLQHSFNYNGQSS